MTFGLYFQSWADKWEEHVNAWQSGIKTERYCSEVLILQQKSKKYYEESTDQQNKKEEGKHNSAKNSAKYHCCSQNIMGKKPQ